MQKRVSTKVRKGRVGKTRQPRADQPEALWAASVTALDVLPSRIAVLDREGTVLLVNRAWRDFAGDAVTEADRASIGDNYLARCAAVPAEAAHLSELAEGLAAVLRAERKEFVLEYPAQIEGEEKWFHGRIRGCSGVGPARAIIAHEDITDSVRLERAVVAVSAHEQQRFRQELHDGLSQQLTGLKFKASLLEYHLQSKELPEAAEAKALSELLNQATDEAANLARRMRPVEVEARGLMMALRELAHNTEQAHEVVVAALIRRPVFIHDNNTATNLYRIAAEAVGAAVEEGQARRIQIGLVEDGTRVTLTVRDNGTPLRQRASTGLGAHIMRYYARMIGGTLEWRREAPRGVSLICSFQKPRAPA